MSLKLEDRVFALNKSQKRKLIDQGFIRPTFLELPVKIVLPEDLSENVVIVDEGGSHLGCCSVKMAWSL
jgi:hypothetical protein